MRTVALVLCAVVAGCGGRSEHKADSGGVVLAVQGTVTAERGDVSRTLVVDGAVTGADTIVTAADSSVRIRLHHNNAVLDLGANKRVALADSAVWRAAPVIAGAFDDQGKDTTAAAGTHAERQAADTAATAAAATTGDNNDPAPGSETPDPGVDRDPEGKGDDDKPAPKRQPGPDKHLEVGDSCDEVSCLLADDPPPCCRKYKPKSGGDVGPPSDGGGSSDLPDNLTRADIMAGMRAIQPALAACAKAHPVAEKTIVKVRIHIVASGSVKFAGVVGRKDALASCVTRAARTARFPRSSRGRTVTYPVVIAPQP